MRKLFLFLTSVLCGGVAFSAEPNQLTFDARVNMNDQLELPVRAAVQDNSTQQFPMSDKLAIELRIESQAWGRWVTAALLDRVAGNRRMVLMDWPVRGEEFLRMQRISFSVCGERFIMLRDGAPGRCADLLPMARPDRLLGQCGAGGNTCIGPYEGMPGTIASHARLAPASEPGVPLRVTGRVLDSSGRPRAGVIVYGYQTDSRGVYPPVTPPRGSGSNYHGRLRGWVRSDAKGHYTFDTIRPGSYGGNPEHIHMHVIEPGCATYIIDDLIFGDDPNYLSLSPEQRQSASHGKGGPGVTKLQHRGKGWAVTRDIHLGEDIPGYQSCGAATSH